MSKFVITIGRQTGSRGRIIGRQLAEKLGVKCYDKEILTVAAKESGYSEDIFKYHDERPTNSFLFNLVMDSYSMGYPMSPYSDLPLSQKVFVEQFNTIKKIANQESCVMIGRCADYALRDYPNLLRIFIHADLDYRAENIAKEDNISIDKARDVCQKTDKKRASYYNYYSDMKWGDAITYDLSINSHVLGIEGTADYLEKYVRAALKI
ncbi:MAG: cytidylate kinase-like family protein [Lachnospiraceae bacterium]|nr:cytidylate kinase-like family protein [Lachnospiraceae bacterium]